MKAITLTALFIAAMAMSHISSAAGAQGPSLKGAHMNTEWNNDDDDYEELGGFRIPFIPSSTPWLTEWWKGFK